MAPNISSSRRLRAALRWPLGMGLTSWRYMWRITPMHRTESAGTPEHDLPPRLSRTVPSDEIQQIEDGTGPLFHRRYSTMIGDAKARPEGLIAAIKADPNLVAPTEFARFHKTHGDDRKMSVGDEFLVHMPGPWDGPVRVVDETPSSYRFATLKGHLEAGQIEFRAKGGECLVFEIESWARSGDRFSNLLFEQLRMAKEIQLHMWSSMLERVVELAQGRPLRGMTIETRRVELDG
jgi:Domain of unknown function (DUF1990)